MQGKHSQQGKEAEQGLLQRPLRRSLLCPCQEYRFLRYSSTHLGICQRLLLRLCMGLLAPQRGNRNQEDMAGRSLGQKLPHSQSKCRPGMPPEHGRRHGSSAQQCIAASWTLLPLLGNSSRPRIWHQVRLLHSPCSTDLRHRQCAGWNQFGNTRLVSTFLHLELLWLGLPLLLHQHKNNRRGKAPERLSPPLCCRHSQQDTPHSLQEQNGLSLPQKYQEDMQPSRHYLGNSALRRKASGHLPPHNSKQQDS